MQSTPVVVALALVIGAMLGIGCGNQGDPFAAFEQRRNLPVQTVSPGDGSTGVSVNTLVTVAFPSELDPDTVHRGTFNLVGADGIPVSRSVTYDNTARVVTIRPTSPLAPSSIFQVIVQGVRPAQSGFGYEPATFTFATGDDPAFGAPEVVAVTPVPEQQNVNVNANIVITFSEAMDLATLTQAFSISGGISGTLSLDSTGRVLTFDPGSALPLGELVLVQVSRLATDRDGVPLRVGFSSSFRTPVPGTFSVVSSVPQSGATTAAPGALLQFTFSEPVDPTTITTNFRISNSALVLPTPVDGNFSFANNNQVVRYDPRPSLTGFVGFPGGSTVQTTFTVDVTSAISGIGLAREFRSNFVVEAIPPAVLMSDPISGATTVPVDQVIRVNFSEPVAQSTINATNFSVTQGPVVAGAFSFEDGGRTVVFTPSANLQNVGVPVIVTLGTGITDLGGTPLAAAVVITFSIDQMAPFVTGRFPDPMPGDQVPVTLSPNGSIRFEFNEDIDQTATMGSFAISPCCAMGLFSFPNSRTLVYTPPTITPPMNAPTGLPKVLEGNTSVMVTLTGFDLAGNGTPVALTFQTDATAPTGIGLLDGMPASSTTNLTPVVSVAFDEIMDKDSLADTGAVLFRQVNPTLIDIPVTLNIVDTAVSFTPPALTLGNTYEVVVDTTVTDLAGNNLAAPVTRQFLVVP